MAKPKTPNQKKLYRELNTRIIEYTAAIERIYNTLNLEAAKAYERTDYNPDSDKPFRWADYPQTKKQIEDLQSRYANDIRTLILTNTSKEWENSNEAQDLLADKVLRAFGVEDITEDRYKRYYQANKDALKNFQERKTKGLNLSQRVWNLSDSYKDELEMAISAGVESGMSANSLATQIKKYLNDPDKLFRRVRDKFGNLVLSKNAKLFHPGQGVYRSSYRNAQRLAISEINMAYRQAENIRWQQLDFVVGYEIKLSTNHNCKGIPLGHFYDICDDLKGKYPKDFVWSGWHPMCYSDDSEVLTNKGWKLFSDVDINDLILSLNPNNRNVEWVEIIDRQCYGYKGDMYHFYNQSLDCLVTPEHQMVYLSKGNGNIKRCEARDYRKGKGGFYRGCVYDAEDRVSITIDDTTLPFDLFCEFMGYWISDGSTIRKSQIVIAQKDGDPNKDIITACIKGMGFRVHSNTDKVEFYCTDLCQYLKGFGLCTDKYVPNEIKHASKRQIRIFLDAYNSCDGSRKKPKPFINDRGKLFAPQNEEIIYFTTSEQMAADLGELILKVGKRPSYFLNKCAGREVEFKNGIYTINHDCYRIAECKAVTATVFKKQIEKYDGYVYDLTLERNHIMYIRRNGKCFWGSNCRCYKVPILKTEDEFWSWDGRGEAPTDSVNKVDRMPDKFLEWQRENADKIARAEQRGTLPYFLRDNKEMLGIGENKSSWLTQSVDGLHSSKSNYIPNEKQIKSFINESLSKLDDFKEIQIDDISISSVVNHGGYFATRRLKNGHHSLSLVNSDINIDGITYNPVKCLDEAIVAISKGIPLSFQQEYAIEGLWHEMLHMKALGWSKKGIISEKDIKLMEACNQLLARNSYQRLLKVFGGKAANRKEILQRGYSSRLQILNLREYIKYHGIRERNLTKFIRTNLMNDNYNNFRGKLIDWLSSHNAKDASELLNSISLANDVFIKKLGR